MSSPEISLLYTVNTPDDRYFESMPLDGLRLKVGDKVIPLEPIVLKLLLIIAKSGELHE